MSSAVDTSEAGMADVDVTVACSSGHVPVKRHKIDEFRQKFTFVPSLPINHDVGVFFNKQHVSGMFADIQSFYITVPGRVHHLGIEVNSRPMIFRARFSKIKLTRPSTERAST